MHSPQNIIRREYFEIFKIRKRQKSSFVFCSHALRRALHASTRSGSANDNILSE